MADDSSVAMNNDDSGTAAWHVVNDKDPNSTSVLSIFNDEESEEESSLFDLDDPYSRLYGGYFPASASTFRKHQRNSLKIPKDRREMTPPIDNTIRRLGLASIGSQKPRDTDRDKDRAKASSKKNNPTDDASKESKERKAMNARVAELEAQVKQLSLQVEAVKGSAAPITADLVPSGPKEYQRLQLNRLDEMGQVDLANIVKNMLVMFNTPLDRIQQFIPALANVLSQDDHYMLFANQVHEKLFDAPINNQGQDADAIKECLNHMISYIDHK